MENTAPEVLVGKAAEITASTAATAAQLKPETGLGKFILTTLAMTSGLTKDCQRIWVDGSSYRIPQAAASAKVNIGLSPETTDIYGGTYESSVVYQSRTITPVEMRLFVSWSKLRFSYLNIEASRRGTGADSHIQKLMATEFANAIEEICVKSENGGTTPSGVGYNKFSTIDGFKALSDSGNIYDHEGGYVNMTLFRKLWNTVPEKWRANHPKTSWRWYVALDVEAMLWEVFQNRATNWGDNVLRSGDTGLTIMGIPVVPVPYWPTDDSGVLSQSASSDEFTSVLLARPANMYLGFRPEMRIFRGTNIEGTVAGLTLYTEWAPQFGVIEEVAKAVNVKPDVS